MHARCASEGMLVAVDSGREKKERELSLKISLHLLVKHGHYEISRLRPQLP